MEPLTAFGLSLTILNIFLNTIDQMRDRGRWIVNLKQKLEEYQLILVACETSFEIWFRLWDQPGDVEANWKSIFGARTWVLIRKRKQAIRDLIDNIRGSLCLYPSSKPRKLFLELILKWKNEKNRKHWNFVVTWWKFTKSLEDIESMPLPHPSIIDRIIRMLGENQRLGQQIAQLKTQVDMLDVVTRNCYKIMGHAEPDPMAKSINQTRDKLKFQALARALATTMRSPSSSGTSPQWFLGLNVPENFKATIVIINEMIEDCAMFFSVSNRTAIDGALQSKEIRLKQLEGASIPYPRPSDPLATAMSNIHEVETCNAMFDGVFLELRTHSTPLLWTQSWQNLLLANAEDKKALEVERAKMALCITIWLILLWETDWFSHICPCAFRSVVFRTEEAGMETEEREHGLDVEDGQQTTSLYRQEHVYSSAARSSVAQQPIIEAHPLEHPCSRRSSPTSRLYFLGIFIAELFLARPIEIVSDANVDVPHKPVYRHRPRAPNGNDAYRPLVLNSDITYELEYHGPGKAVSDAVNFCFAKAYDPEWTSFDQSKSATRTAKLIEKVLQPLTEVYVEYKKNKKPRFAKNLFPAMEKYEDASFRTVVQQPVNGNVVVPRPKAEAEAEIHVPQEIIAQQEVREDIPGRGLVGS